MSVQDDLGRLALSWARWLAQNGEAARLRQQAGLSLSEVGKAAGVTADQIGLFETGRATPSTGQLLAWLGFVLERASWRETAGKTG